MGRKNSTQNYNTQHERITQAINEYITQHNGAPTIVTTALYPGPIAIRINFPDGRLGIGLTSPTLMWRRDNMVLTLHLDGSRGFDYSTGPITREEMATLPEWCLQSVYAAPNSGFDLRGAIDFADQWGLELVPFWEADELYKAHFALDPAKGEMLTGEEAASRLEEFLNRAD